MHPSFLASAVCLTVISTALANQPEGNAPSPPAPAGPASTVTRTSVLPDPSMNVMKGKIDRMDPEKKQLLLRTKNGKEPIPYQCNAATKFLDLDGKPVDTALLKPETPVEVSFAEDGNNMIASTVVVQRIQAPLPGGGVTLTNRETLKPGGKVVEEVTKTTVTTSSGTVSKLEPGILTVKIEGEAHPRRYQYSGNTAWVNTQGETIPVGVLKAGQPVRISFTREGDTFIADQVAVSLPAPVEAPSNEIKDTTPKE